MPLRSLLLDDVRSMNSAENVGVVFQKLGYNVLALPLNVADLELSDRSAEGLWNAYLIADQKQGTESLQVLLLQLAAEEWQSPSIASGRMRSIAQSLSRRPGKFLLLGTQNYDQLMLVNPRTSFDAQMNLKTTIRKLLIDRTNPTAYDRDRLEAIAAGNLSPLALYQAQCDAFDVEKLTKAFYQEYREVFTRVQKVIRNSNAHPYFDDASRLHQFAQRLLGRIMFLYFLQKKGFLAGDRNFLKNQYSRLHSEPEDKDFYSTVLEPLFFEMLNKQRPNLASPWGKIPYLNGGLFDRDYGAGIVDATHWATPERIELPNSLFDPSGEKGILKFFGSYNFTVSENVQGDEDVAVDPEMLGKVFENLLAAEERGQSGTFYTPRGIVHFMCVESLSRYLADESGVDLEVVKQLTEYDAAMPDAAIKKRLSKEQAKRLKQALETVKVCDPAVGSGAFPLGMMQVILTVRQAIAAREGMSVERGSLALSEWKREIIANNLYGVDIKPEAVEIAKLRLWLSLVVDIPTAEDVEPLPNLDYKLMCGNSLISTINGERMIPDPTKNQQIELAVTPVQAEIQKLVALQQQYFHAQADDRAVLKGQILEAEAAVFRVAIGDRRQHWQSEQRKLKQDIARMGKTSRAQSQKQQTIEGKLQELDQVEVNVSRGLRSIDFFQWHLHFNEVFAEKGGFDVVIGNPPYVRQEKLPEQFKQELKGEFPQLFNGTADIYTYFYGKGVELLRSNGNLAFISPNKWFRANYGVNLRKYLSETCRIHSITDFGELPVFDAATFPMIFTAQKDKAESAITFTQVKSLGLPYPNVQAIVNQQGQSLPSGAIDGADWALTDARSVAYLQKMEVDTVRLSEYVHKQIYYGVKTGFNTAFKLTGEERAKLIDQDPKSVEIIKPLAVGDDIRKWHIRDKDSWLIFTRRGIDIDQYPAVKTHLEQWKLDLTPKETGHEIRGRKAGRYRWYEIQDDVAYWAEFNKPKIIYPVIAKESRFSFDTKGSFSNDKAFIIPVHDLYLLGVLNSAVVWNYLKSVCSALGDAEKGGRLELRGIYMSKVPIPQASSADRQAISTLVQHCLDAKGQGVKQWEDEINDRVGKLYGLTAAEMQNITSL